MIMFMFKSTHGLVPNYLFDEITMQRDIAVRITRFTINKNVHVPHILHLNVAKMHLLIEVPFF